MKDYRRRLKALEKEIVVPGSEEETQAREQWAGLLTTFTGAEVRPEDVKLVGGRRTSFTWAAMAKQWAEEQG